MNKEINKIISWIEMSYTRLNYKEELLLVNYIVQLQQENQSLKKENKILRENAEHNDKVVDKVNWENQELKKQLEKTNTTLDTHNELIEYMKNQQKEFINFLENEKNIYPYDISDCTYEDIINTILSKYYEIIEK